MCGKTIFVFGLLIAIVVFSCVSMGESNKHAMRDEQYNIMKDFFTGNFNVPVADRTRLQKSAYVKFWTLRKGLSINLEGSLLYDKIKNCLEKWREKDRDKNFDQKQIWRMS